MPPLAPRALHIEGKRPEVRRQFEEDMPIWESKRFVATPALAPTERPVTEFRRWASQFYATHEPV